MTPGATASTPAVAHRRGRVRAAAAALFVIALIGYPVAGLVASAMDWDSLIASIPLRVATLLLAGWLWLTSRNPGRRRGGFWLVAFGLMYLLRLTWDLGVAQVQGAVDAMAFFLATVAIPAIALWRVGPAFSERQATRWMFLLGATICVSALAMHTFGIGQDRSLTEATGRLSFEALNPITIGHVAATTLIAALCMLGRGLRTEQAPLLLAGSVAAGATLLLAASRGPLLCLAAAGVVFALATRRWHWLVLLALALMPFLLSSDSELLLRFSTIEEDESALERLVLQANAIGQFLANPIFGSAYVELELQTYPHNLIVETAMALGLAGLVALLIILTKTFGALRRHVRAGQLLVPLLLVQYLVGAQLSGAIYGHGPLAACIALLLATPRPSPRGWRRAPIDTGTDRPRLPRPLSADHP